MRLALLVFTACAPLVAWSATVGDDIANVAGNSSVVIPVLANDTGNWVNYSFTQGANGTVSVAPGAALMYRPNPNFTGLDSFTYSLAEASGDPLTATVTVTVAPLVQDDQVVTPFETPVVIPFLKNDSGNWVDGSVTQGLNGLVAGIPGPLLLHTPNPGFTGIDSFDYTLTDASGAVLTATVTVTVDSTGPGDATLPDFTCSPQDAVCNVTQAAGLGADISYGRGVAFVDIDGDGWDDIFAADTDGRFDPLDFGVSKFYKNNGDGTYLPVDAADLGISDESLKATWVGSFADYDNDGDADLLLANGGYTAEWKVFLYENQVNTNGQFVDVTATMGIDAANGQLGAWWGASWADYDGDGFLDAVVTPVVGRPLLFHNNGGLGFTETSIEMGIDIEFIKVPNHYDNGKNPVWIDYDNDGDPDLYIAGILKHAFFENVDGDVFVDITQQIFGATLFQQNLNFEVGSPVVSAAAADDFNQDGWDDLYLGRWSEQDMVLMNDKRGGFKPAGKTIGLDALHSRFKDTALPYENTMGLGIGDLFNDGYPDAYIGTGNPARADADIFYCNTKGVGFSRCTDLFTATANKVYRTRAHGTVFADVDHDGNTDMFVNLGGHPKFDHEAREQNALWVRPSGPGLTASVTLQGTLTNRDALGAKVRVQAGSEINYYAVRSTQGFQSQNSKRLIIAIGSAESADITVFWPSGVTSTATATVGEALHIVE